MTAKLTQLARHSVVDTQRIPSRVTTTAAAAGAAAAERATCECESGSSSEQPPMYQRPPQPPPPSRNVDVLPSGRTLLLLLLLCAPSLLSSSTMRLQSAPVPRASGASKEPASHDGDVWASERTNDSARSYESYGRSRAAAQPPRAQAQAAAHGTSSSSNSHRHTGTQCSTHGAPAAPPFGLTPLCSSLLLSAPSPAACEMRSQAAQAAAVSKWVREREREGR